MKTIVRDAAFFLAVGCTAAATHWTLAVACVAYANLPPLLANVVGWLVAFAVSFAGHYRWTFRNQPKALALAFRRFFVVSAGGFVINESAYAALLNFTALPYDLLLAAILLAIAALTFVLGRFWAFRHTPAAG
jgi:putative flippase GtrA